MPATKVIHPTGMIALGDSNGDGAADGEISFHKYRTFYVVPPGTRHNNGANIVFCDGHVEWAKQSKWLEFNDHAASRWNNDHQPHRNLWVSW